MKNYSLVFWILLIVPCLIYLVFFHCASMIERTPEDHYELVLRDYIIQNEVKEAVSALALTTDSTDVHSKVLAETIEQMHSLFDEWNDSLKVHHNSWIQVEKTANKNFSIWLAVIAAICTVLPVVLSLHQNHTFEERLKEAKNQMDEKISESSERVKKENEKIAKLSNRLLVTELLEMASRNLNVMNNLTELEVRENVLITCADEVKRGIDAVLDSLIQCENNLHQVYSLLTQKERSTIINSYFCMLCVFREMLYRYESEFTGVNLVKLQQDRYLVSVLIKQMIDLEKNPNIKEFEDIDLRQIMGEVREYVVVANCIFTDQLRESINR